MSITEAEAKTKMCCGPMARNVQPQEFCCVGSKCMAWRWSEAKRTLEFLSAVREHMQSQPKPNFNTSVQAVYAETCGRFERVEGYGGYAGDTQ